MHSYRVLSNCSDNGMNYAHNVMFLQLKCGDPARRHASTAESTETSEVVPLPSRKMKGSENIHSVKYTLGNLKKYV